VISVLDLFNIGIGPSSSHTVGPMKAARRFVHDIATAGDLSEVDAITVDLYGSLALTGKGHGTDRAILLGLSGELPEEVDPSTIDCTVAGIQKLAVVRLLGKHPIAFDPEIDLAFRGNKSLPGHSNGMRFVAYNWGRQVLASRIFYSIGGGFIIANDDHTNADLDRFNAQVPFPFKSATDLLRLGRETHLRIWEIALANEIVFQSEEQIRARVSRFWSVMQECADRGLRTEGTLPGELNVRRRAPQLYRDVVARGPADPLRFIDWVTLFAIAINEENACGGRVVTAPTNGAAGVIPAVADYYLGFVNGSDDDGIFRYFLTAGIIGVLYKQNASISAAEVGCQGEIGVASSMAAGGLVAALGGTNEQVEHAAEIAMEHHLGMTCDPIGGLVQIPCIERNAFGALNAIQAARMSMNEKGEHKVTLDQVIRTMYETGRDMNARYKETSLAGLALTVVQC